MCANTACWQHMSMHCTYSIVERGVLPEGKWRSTGSPWDWAVRLVFIRFKNLCNLIFGYGKCQAACPEKSHYEANIV